MHHEVPFGDHALYRTKRGVTALLRSVVLFAGLNITVLDRYTIPLQTPGWVVVQIIPDPTFTQCHK